MTARLHPSHPARPGSPAAVLLINRHLSCVAVLGPFARPPADPAWVERHLPVHDGDSIPVALHDLPTSATAPIGRPR